MDMIINAPGAVPAEGDYRDEDGLLRCGRCGTRKETVIFLNKGNTAARKRVRCVCRCEREKQEEEERKRALAEAESKIRGLRRASLMDERFYGATFGKARVTEHNAKNIAACRKYVEHFPEMLKKRQGFLFWGNVGTGKSFAAACIANALMDKGVPVVMTSFVKAVGLFRDSAGEEGVMSAISAAQLAVFDDLGAERSTEYAIEKVYDIIDSRYRSGLPMIVTTNLSMKEMLEDGDVRYGRIYDRIFEMCYPVQWTGPSWRKSMAWGRFEEMGKLLGG